VLGLLEENYPIPSPITLKKIKIDKRIPRNLRLQNLFNDQQHFPIHFQRRACL